MNLYSWYATLRGLIIETHEFIDLKKGLVYGFYKKNLTCVQVED